MFPSPPKAINLDLVLVYKNRYARAGLGFTYPQPNPIRLPPQIPGSLLPTQFLVVISGYTATRPQA